MFVIFSLIVFFSYKPSFIHLIVLWCWRLVIPITFDSQDIYFTAWFIGCCNLILLGLIIGSKVKNRDTYMPSVNNSLDSGALKAAVIVSVLLIFYHYYIVGIPILSDSIEMSRFQQRGSGMLGIPSRFAAYFPIMLLIFCVISCVKGSFSPIDKKLLIAVSILLFIVKGDKTALISMIFILIVCYRFSFDVINYKKIFPFLGVGGAMFFIYMFNSYGSLSDYTLSSYLIDRLSGISLEPVKILFSSVYFDPKLISSSAIINDLLYPIYQILGIPSVTLNTQLSHFIYNSESWGFTVPVTPTIVAYINFEFGLFPGLFVCLMLGWFLSFVYHLPKKNHSTFALTVLLSTEYFIYTGVGSGNMFYLIPNVLLVFTTFFALYISINILRLKH